MKYLATDKMYSYSEISNLLVMLKELAADVESLTEQLKKAEQLNRQLIEQNCNLHMERVGGEPIVMVH